jgi:hypothetical protein
MIGLCSSVLYRREAFRLGQAVSHVARFKIGLGHHPRRHTASGGSPERSLREEGRRSRKAVYGMALPAARLFTEEPSEGSEVR